MQRASQLPGRSGVVGLHGHHAFPSQHSAAELARRKGRPPHQGVKSGVARADCLVRVEQLERALGIALREQCFGLAQHVTADTVRAFAGVKHGQATCEPPAGWNAHVSPLYPLSKAPIYSFSGHLLIRASPG
jgi:hypothetical protein